MKKSYLVLAAVAALFAACSSDNNDAAERQTVKNEPVAIGFDTYVDRGTTRSGVPGSLTTDALKTTAGDMRTAGFGVFAYYTGDIDYDQQQIPNFMYNQQVISDGTKFSYTPVKYWPNEYGTTAISEDADKISFFAYAPWVESVTSSGKVDDATWGIAGMTRNSATGDPIIKYIGSFSTNNYVDLCWGVYNATNWEIIQTGAGQSSLTAGLPWLNVQRPKETTQPVTFTFKHALAKLNVQIDAYVDGTNNTNAIAAGSKVYVRSITFEGIASKGALNLNNETDSKANWLDFNGVNALETGEGVTIFDGLKDGKEGTTSAEATNEKVLGLNPVVISNPGNTSVGVTKTPVNLFGKWDDTTKKYVKYDVEDAAADKAIYVIPTSETFKVSIVYDIETADNNLATYTSDLTTPGTSMECKITKPITWGTTTTALENGKAYTLKLHLGMNSIEFDASVSDWDTGDDGSTDLPAN